MEVEEIFETGKDQKESKEVTKPKRVLTDKQKEALKKGRAKAKAARDAKKAELNELEIQKDVKELKTTQRKIKKKTIERQEAVLKRVKRNEFENKFNDLKFKIAGTLQSTKELNYFNKLCDHFDYEDFKDPKTMEQKFKTLIKSEVEKHKKK